MLSRRPVEVEELEPGYLQVVRLEGIAIQHLHAPAGSDGREEREAMFRQMEVEAQGEEQTTMLVGNFNAVIDRYNTERWDHAKGSEALRGLVQRHKLVDSYRVLHPCEKRYSWFRRGYAASRLDRLYLPKQWESMPRLARYIPSTSDHSAFLLKVDWAGLGLPVEVEGGSRRKSHYWKLNTSLMKEEDFQPAFQSFWNELQPRMGQEEVTKAWEAVAKPAIAEFCKDFAARTGKRKQLSGRFFTKALERALELGQWEEAAVLKERLAELDGARARGAGVRARQEELEGEVPGLFQWAAEGRQGASTGLTEIKTATREILTEKEAVQKEVCSYFEALFHGRHKASADRPEPYDSGEAFQEDFGRTALFLQGLPKLTAEEKEGLEVPFELEELEEAVKGAANNKLPGLDGLPYELYKATFQWTGKPLLEALNGMLAKGELTTSLRRGVVRLLPKGEGVPTAGRLRPITLLACDYKLLTKMMVARLVKVLPDVLKATQMCSVEGRSIFNGAAAILSAAEYLKQRQLPGFVASLDFFHAYDWVSLRWVDQVLEAMGFGDELRG